MNRDIRRLQNSKNTNIAEGSKKSVMSHAPAVSNMADGEQVFAQEANRPLALYKKNKGSLWKSYFSNNGNQIVDRTLIADELKFTRKFTDYKFFNHNFQDNLDTNEHFLPMNGTVENSSMNESSTSFLVPYKMTLKKIIFRPETLDDVDATLTFRIKKQINGSVSVVTVASFEYDTQLASNTLLQVNESDFDNSPTVVAGEKLAISLTADADPDGSTTIDYYITSVWKTEILI